MGLDNGLEFRIKHLNDVNKEVFEKQKATLQDNVYEVFYWRKCWGFRDKILSILGEENEKFEYIVCKDHLRQIAEFIQDCFINEYEISPGDSLSYYYARMCTHYRYIYLINYILDNWDDMEIEEITFYDSY